MIKSHPSQPSWLITLYLQSQSHPCVSGFVYTDLRRSSWLLHKKLPPSTFQVGRLRRQTAQVPPNTLLNLPLPWIYHLKNAVSKKLYLTELVGGLKQRLVRISVA